MIPGMPAPDQITLVFAIIGSVLSVLGFISWKMGKRKKIQKTSEA